MICNLSGSLATSYSIRQFHTGAPEATAAAPAAVAVAVTLVKQVIEQLKRQLTNLFAQHFHFLISFLSALISVLTSSWCMLTRIYICTYFMLLGCGTCFLVSFDVFICCYNIFHLFCCEKCCKSVIKRHLMTITKEKQRSQL